MRTSSLAASFLFVALCQSPCHSQGESAVPFLLIHPSPESNGWGNVGTAVVSSNPIGTIANPGQLGMFSLGGYFAASSYVGSRRWLPGFQQPDLTYDVLALSGGYDISKSVDLPFRLGVALGYSRIDLNLGEFVVTSSGGPDPVGTYHAFEFAEAMSVGLGIDYWVRLGLGVSVKNVVSVLGPVQVWPGTIVSGRAEVTVADYGLLLDVPVMDILAKIRKERMTIGRDFYPLANISAGYALRNLSDKYISYIWGYQADPLPRSVTIGLSLEAGVSTTAGDQSWKVLTVSLAREAEDLLVVRYPGGSSAYQSGLGDIAFFRHVIEGRLPESDRVNLHKGWQLNLGEFVYIRGGSFAESPRFGNRNFSTSGIGIHSTGAFKLLEVLSPGALSGTVAEFIVDHIDISYDRAEYSAPGSHPLSGTTFHSLNLVIR